MEDILLLEAIERYLNNEMPAEEREYFEQLRINTPEIDQMVVEHKLFLQQIEAFSEHNKMKHSVIAAHQSLLEKGEIHEGGELTVKGKVIQMWHRYKRVATIAASIAGITALFISGLTSYFSPGVDKEQLQQLSQQISRLQSTTNQKLKETNQKLKEIDSKIPKDATIISGGTAFLIDGKGYLVTNAHVLKGSGAVVVNNKGQEYFAKILNIDQEKDLAILKIQDKDYVPAATLPYGIKKNDADLGTELFTLGYPQKEIVYNLGYLSSENGHNGDTTNYQVSLTANPGNSGGPVFNKNGEVIGIISTKETQSEGVVYAIKAKNIFSMVNELRDTDTSINKIKIQSYSSIKNAERTQQIKEVEDCVFIVKAFSEK